MTTKTNMTYDEFAAVSAVGAAAAGYYVRDPEMGMSEFPSLEEARREAESTLTTTEDFHLYPDGFEGLEVGRLVPLAEATVTGTGFVLTPLQDSEEALRVELAAARERLKGPVGRDPNTAPEKWDVAAWNGQKWQVAFRATDGETVRWIRQGRMRDDGYITGGYEIPTPVCWVFIDEILPLTAPPSFEGCQ